MLLLIVDIIVLFNYKPFNILIIVIDKNDSMSKYIKILDKKMQMHFPCMGK